MGRHSSDSEWHFYRSVLAWFLPWIVIAGVIGVAIWIGVDAIGGDDDPIVAASPSPKGSKSPSPKESASAEPTAEPSKSPKPDATPTPTPSAEVELITEGINVQILNGSGVAGAEEAMDSRLSDLGFEIAAVGQASKEYERTTVFWSFASSKKAAKALAARFGWVAELKPENLSASVAIHVIVGVDEG
jgi:hypothetical protein